MTSEGLDAAEEHVARLRSRAAGSLAGGGDAALVREEVAYATALLDLAITIGRVRLGDRSRSARERLDALATEALERHGSTWSARHRPGGRPESGAWIARAHTALTALSS